MESFKINGTLYQKNDTVPKSDTFKVREFIVEVINEKNSEWNDLIKFQLENDKCSAIDSTAIGASITVYFNLRGRKWEKDGKVNFFNTLTAWKIEAEQAQSDQPTASDAQSRTQEPGEKGDYLPF